MKLLNNFVNFLKISNNRTKNISKHILLSFIVKGGAMTIGLILVPLSISYLGPEKYGLWLALFSFIGWFSFFDFGIGNGLRNKLAESIANEDNVLSRSLVSTAYFSISALVLFLLLLFFILNRFIPWESVFNYSGDENIVNVVVVVFTMFSINLVLKIVDTIYLADQKPSVPGFFHLLGQIIILITIYLTLKFDDQSLFFYGAVVVGSQLFVLMIASVIAFSSRYSHIKPSISSFKFEHVKDIMSLGSRFLIIQINAIIIFSTDNFIINYYLGADQVTVFNIVVKYFAIITMGVYIIFTPYWSAFTEAISKAESNWVKHSFKRLFTFSILACIGIVLMVYISENVYLFWIGDTIEIPFMLTILVAISSAIMVLKQPAIMLINGVGDLKNQIIVSTIGAIINIPLSIILAVNYNLGVLGVVLATIATGVIGLVVYNRQIYKFLKKY